ncbi:hypothetical protein AB6N01_09980 [Alcaligenes nematophilus]|uniref:Uncharacterized protein n=2 Tax=Alcaligenes TaxID=507 RepID=A0ABY7N0D5_ALCFA|nr:MULTISPECIES: hypothetical protein [Alcaligenes]MCX5565762.1 hypothetical protein [Alcaligenes phenolicus]WBM37575.1 hypothetical protein M2J83_17510 [Alcaligenes faecalis]
MNHKENDKEAAQIDYFVKYFAVGVGVGAALVAVISSSVPAALVCIAASIFYHRPLTKERI